MSAENKSKICKTLMFMVQRMVLDLNTSQQPAIIIKAAYSSEMLVHCYQPTQGHIS